MKEFVAKGSRQLDICLRMLFANGIKFNVIPYKDEKEHVYYIVAVKLNKQKYDELSNLYKTLIK